MALGAPRRCALDGDYAPYAIDPQRWTALEAVWKLSSGLTCNDLEIADRAGGNIGRHAAWHPSPFFSRLYAVATADFGVTLIDGIKHHTIKQVSTPMADMLGRFKRLHAGTCREDGRAVCTWISLTWAPDGSRLFLAAPEALAVMHFAPEEPPYFALTLIKSASHF